MVCAAIRRLTPCRTFTVGSFWTAKIRVGRCWGPQWRGRNENLRFDHPHPDGAHGRGCGGHEQCLQERAARLVRSDVDRT